MAIIAEQHPEWQKNYYMKENIKMLHDITRDQKQAQIQTAIHDQQALACNHNT